MFNSRSFTPRADRCPDVCGELATSVALADIDVRPREAESVAEVAFTQSSAAVTVWDYVEVTLSVEGLKVSNPFTEVSVTGWFQADGGPKLAVDGFCDSQDGCVYRIRFMPMASGVHQYSITMREGNSRKHIHSGLFTAVDQGRKGMVQVDQQHPWHFIWAGTGEHYFYNGTTTYMMMGLRDQDIEHSINRLADFGTNRIRVTMSMRVENAECWFEPVYPSERFSFVDLNPWVAANPESAFEPGYDVTRFNTNFWQKFERLLTWAKARDMVVSVVFYTDGARAGVDPFGDVRSEDELRYYRYAVARFGAFPNVMWDISNEYRFLRTDSWAKWMGYYLKSKDVYGHPTSIHGFEDFRFRTEPWVDFAMYQCWDEAGGNAYMVENRQQQLETGRVMPQVNEEYGYGEHYPKKWGGARVHPARDDDSRRRIAWEVSLAGCYQTTGEMAYTGGGWLNGWGDDKMVMLRGYGYMVDFFTSYKWWLSNPHNELILSYEGADFSGIGYFTSGNEGKEVQRTAPALCLADLGETYAVYLPAGGSAVAALVPGTYSVTRYNPRTGQWFDGGKAVVVSTEPDSTGRWNTPEVEDHGDWAFLLKRER